MTAFSSTPSEAGHSIIGASPSSQSRSDRWRCACSNLGIAVDAHHVWRDRLLTESLVAVRGKVLGFHLCDRVENTRHMLLDRGMIGGGVAELRAISAAVEDKAGYTGMCEVEVFSADNWWKRDPAKVLDVIVERFRRIS